MSKPTLILTVGLPRSGKSTYLRTRWPRGILPIVCPDEIRRYLGCFPFAQHMEPFVWWVARLMVEVLFAAGCNEVALDATNVTKRRRDEWKSDKWTRSYYVFDTPVDECIDRARSGGKDYLVPVIQRMARDADWMGEFFQPDFPEPFIFVK